jgi:hypothetical protein
MNRIKRYFESFDSFILFVYGLRRRTREYYYQVFQRSIQYNLVKLVKAHISNQEFTSGVNNLLSLPTTIQVNNQESVGICCDADRTLQGVYNLLGSGDVKLTPINWHTDFKTGFIWPPGTFYKKYRQEGIDTDSDVKLPRELSRCHHLLKTGLAYKLTGKGEYAKITVSQINSWIYENPLMKSINWGCAMDVSIRAVNWIWALGLVNAAKELDDNALESIKVSLYEHGWFIYRNPEKGVENNHNHYLADLSGQIHLGLIFYNLAEPKKWLERGKRELFREIRIQILPTGMSYERSTCYNRLVLELILIPILLLKRAGHEIPSDIWYRLEKMFEFILYSLKPDGNTPIIGDQDNGRLLPFGIETRNNYKYLLSLGALLFNRSDFKRYGNGFNVYCSLLAGNAALVRWDTIKETTILLQSRAYPDTGLYVMRKNSNYLLFNVTGKGLFAETASSTHTHSDLLSFELVSNGKTFLVDPGSYVYTASAKERMFFRSTKMHNTVTIDGEPQNEIKEQVLWDFKRDAIPEIIGWESDETRDMISASHTGYLRLIEPVTHQRTVIFNKQTVSWSINDELTGVGNHLFEWFFHFDTGIDFIENANGIQTSCTDGNNIQISFSGLGKLALRKEASFISKGYGEKEPAMVLVASIQCACPVLVNIQVNPIITHEAII